MAVVAQIQRVKRALVLRWGQVKNIAVDVVFRQHLATDPCDNQQRHRCRPVRDDEGDGHDQNAGHDPDRGMTVQQRKSCGDCAGCCIKCRCVEYHSVRVKQNALYWKGLTLRQGCAATAFGGGG